MKIRGNKGNISLLLLVNNGGNNINAIDLLWNPFQNLFYDIRMKFPVDGVRADIVFSVRLGNYERTLVQPIYLFSPIYGILAADIESPDGMQNRWQTSEKGNALVARRRRPWRFWRSREFSTLYSRVLRLL